METNKKLSLSQIGLYNPQRLNDEAVEQLFVVRTALFNDLVDKIKKEKNNSIPQHHLIIGQRGMGKTTILKRLEVEFRKQEMADRFIPLLFPEEQYNLKNLSEFWLNCLDALADTLEFEKHTPEVQLVDRQVEELEEIKDSSLLAKKAFEFLKTFTKSLMRRPVLLIDNMSLIFTRLNKEEQHTLRAWLMQNGSPILVGASSISMDDTSDYNAPFYDAFQMRHLKKLSFEELVSIITNLAKLTQEEAVLSELQSRIARLKTLHQLTGGNPRTATMLFRVIIKGFSNDINDDLEALLDEITPLYKARFEELPAQMQVIVDAIALSWDPVKIEQLRKETGYENNQLSPQLKRLLDEGWIDKISTHTGKGFAYQISERFFNIWFLMRRSSRRKKRELYCLSRFLESFYGDEIKSIAQNHLLSKQCDEKYLSYTLALADAIKDTDLQLDLILKSYKDLNRLTKENPEIIKLFDLEEVLGKLDEQKAFVKFNNLIDAGEYLSADETIEILIAKTTHDSKSNAILLCYKAAFYNDYLHDFLGAEQAFKRAIKLDHEYADAWNGLGYLYMDNLKNYQEAEKAFLKAIELDNKFAYPWNGLGNLYQNHLSRFSESENAYLKSIELDKYNANPWNGLGTLYMNYLNKYPESEQAYLKAIELDKELVNSWNGLGYLYMYFLNRYSESEQAFLNAIEIDEKFAFSWNGLGNLYQYYLSRHEEAEQSYYKAIESINEYASPWNGLGNLYMRYFKRYIEAEQVFMKAIEIQKDYAGAWHGLGNLYKYHLKKYPESEQAYLKAIELDPTNTVPLNSLGNLYQDQFERFQEAEQVYMKAIELNSMDAYTWTQLGNLYQNHLEKYTEAEKAYMRAIEINPKLTNQWNNLGNLFLDHLKKYPEAEQAFLRAIDLDQKLDSAKYNLVFLYRDKMNRIEEAEIIMNTLQPNSIFEDSYWLNMALSELYKRNEGVAEEYLVKAIHKIDDQLPASTRDDWFRSGAVVVKLGYSKWFASIMEKTGYDTILSPFYVAIIALGEKDPEGYLNSKAVEIREPAREIMEIMKEYNR